MLLRSGIKKRHVFEKEEIMILKNLSRVAAWGGCGTKDPEKVSGGCGTKDPLFASGGCGSGDPKVSGGCGTKDPA